jgi:hypothetical protein
VITLRATLSVSFRLNQIRRFESLSETVEQAVSQGHLCIGSIAVVSSDLGSAAEAAAHSIASRASRSQHQGDKWIAA